MSHRCLSFVCIIGAALLMLSAVGHSARGEDLAEGSLAQRIYQQCAESMVSIISADREGEQRGIGTGFVFGDQGYIATNLHVIGRSRSFRVQTQDGKRLPVEAIQAFDGGLDLAILKVSPHDLPPLKLADDQPAKIGQNVVVLGNPQGLENSVVAGVLSATRQIDTRDMLQLAIPIEPGNSGGPVLNPQGEVLGIVTMKSSITNNLGFAVAIEHLKQLLEKPNPVRYDRWLTIGVLDDKTWQPMFGSKWTQRAGRIMVEQPGDGFGGRSLCLRRAKPDQVPYEISVQVKLDQPDGAAGLAFLSDGNTRHYGLYPSSGRIRVTRFDGPTVYQWTVLDEATIEGLDPQNWIHLKVRVEHDQFSCYVNDEQVYQAIYDPKRYVPQSQFGLVKFRHTTAAFKQLKIGKRLPNFAPPAEELVRWQEQLSSSPTRAEMNDAQLAKWSEQAAVARFALRQQADQLRREAAQLDLLAQDVHVAGVLAGLEQKLTEPDWNLFDAGMQIARLDDDQLEVTPYRQQLDVLKAELQETLPDEATTAEKLEHLRRFLFEENGFHGSRSEYYSRANSYLSRVMDDREGIPVTLSVVYLELAEAIGLEAEGVGLPGHFVVRITPEEGDPQLIDVFDGGTPMSQAEAEAKIRDIVRLEPEEDHFAAVPKRQILERMLLNLTAIAQDENNLPALLRYYQALTVVNGDSPQYQGMKALLLHETGRTAAAIEQLDWLDANMKEEIGAARLGQIREYFQRGG